MTTEPPVVLRESPSRLDEELATPAARLAFDNDVRFHVSRHLLHLRRFRGMSQTRLASKIGTSQSAIARIESGDENPTLDTVARAVVALEGRVQISIPPAELSTSRRIQWWEIIDGPEWTVTAVGHRVNVNYEQALLLLQRPLNMKQLALSNETAA